MVMMDSRDLLTEVSTFLKVTLREEKLSDHAESCRQKLIAKLSKRDVSPLATQAYTDMNGRSYCHAKVQHQISHCYEEFDRSFDSDTKNKPHTPDGFMDNLYNNLTSMQEENIYANNDDTENYINIEHTSQNQEKSLYICPTSALANTPVNPSKPSLVQKSTSESSSERNSVISYKKDSPDRISVSSSLTSNSRCEESPEVLATSASAMRYAATKTGVLRRKEKIFIIDHTKHYWVALLNQTLFFFNSDKDSKPLFELDVSSYKARSVDISPGTKPDYKFELISPGSKTHQFCAEKESDMNAWVSLINTKPLNPMREWGCHMPSLPVVQNTYDQLDSRRMTSPVTYDQPDSDKRPLIETEYELPDGVASSINQSKAVHMALSQELTQFLNTQTKGRRSSDQLVIPLKQSEDRRSHSPSGKQSASPRETRRLPLLPQQQQETYDNPEPIVRPVNENPEIYETLCEEVYHCIYDNQLQNLKEPRQLPLLPLEQDTYDKPEPTARPVNNLQNVKEVLSDSGVCPVQKPWELRKLPLLPQQQMYNQPDPNVRSSDNPDIVQEEFYSNIDTVESDRPSSQEGVYNNMIPEDFESDFDDDTDDEANYYNTVPYPERETDQECIYDVITEQRQLLSASPVRDNTNKCLGAAVPPSSTVEQGVKRLDERSVSVKNMATIFSRSFIKPQLREVKPPVINKSYR